MAPLTRGRKKALSARAAPEIHPADRISNLPEGIQAQILSFLPAEEAVRTCVLARTWRDVWKSTRRLLITDQAESALDFCGIAGIGVVDSRFVDCLLRQRLAGIKDHGPIDACEIVVAWASDVDGVDGIFEIASAVGRWIPCVLKCHVQSLRVDLYDCDYVYFPMRGIPLVSRQLTRLDLSGLWFDIHGCLDFSGCPALQHLEIIDCDFGSVNKVTSPYVKRLVIKQCNPYHRLEICFPHLVSLWLEDFVGKALVLESMPQLAVAYVSIDEHTSVNDSDITKCMVLQGLAEAKHLVLLSKDNTITFTRDLRFCPTYSKLKTLVLNHCWCKSADCSALACMLRHAPVLEKLTILFSDTVEPKYDMVVEGSPDASRISTMISQHLKIVELKCFELNKRVENVLRFLGRHHIKFLF